MPLVSPFVGERYRNSADVSRLISPPYDVISSSQREAYQARNDHNIVRLILPEGNGDRYARAAETLRTWRADGVLVRDDSPSVYVVRQEFEDPEGQSHVRTGVIAAVAVEPYSRERVRPHEKTHRGPKEDRLALMRSTRAMFEALLMMARDSSGELQERLQAVTVADPDVQAHLESVSVFVWRIFGADAGILTRAAAGDGALYIADGHHRYETANAYREENPAADRTLAMIVPLGDPGLVVLPTHRLITGDSIDEIAVRRLARDSFDIAELGSFDEGQTVLAAHRNRSTACVVCLPGTRTFSLQLKADLNFARLPLPEAPSVRALDITRIDKLIVDELEALAGVRARRWYDASARSVADAVDSGKAAAGVLVNPTGVEQVLAVADAGAFMPQKSTFFAPKVPSGLVILGWRHP